MELTNTYPVQDKNNQQEELKRLVVQDHMFTTVMGGVLPEQQDPIQFRRILDIGCGPGGWILEMAQKYPQIEKLCGIDISTAMVQYALEQAKQRQLSTGVRGRVEFHAMDALRMLEFPDNFFDLVNLRLVASFIRQWEWPKLFSEIHRVLRVGGLVRIVETPIRARSSSQAVAELYSLLCSAFFKSGRLFREEPAGLVDELPALLERHGFQQIKSIHCEIEYRAGTEIGDAALQDTALLFRTFRQFLYRYECLPENYDALCQQAAEDFQQPGFVSIGDIYTFWAVNP
jgi:ubiquinone/menaquinone biosynthesis C-methylase UbiE